MQDIQYSNALFQLCEILKYVEEDLKNRIPEQLINYFEENKSKDYNWEIDITKPLVEQQLLQTTKEFLTVIYRDYMCDEKQKEELDRVLNDNEKKYQEELRKKYNPDDIFKQRKNEIKEEEKVTENITEITVYKESLIKKILNKIRLFFKRR